MTFTFLPLIFACSRNNKLDGQLCLGTEELLKARMAARNNPTKVLAAALAVLSFDFIAFPFPFIVFWIAVSRSFAVLSPLNLIVHWKGYDTRWIMHMPSIFCIFYLPYRYPTSIIIVYYTFFEVRAYGHCNNSSCSLPLPLLVAISY
jgi:hypothetical protein